MKQRQFLEVIDRDEAERRWREVIDAGRREPERVPLASALGRVLAEPVRSQVDVPGFDRSDMDGFAVRAEDTYGASEEEPVALALEPIDNAAERHAGKVGLDVALGRRDIDGLWIFELP